ncbi:kinetochore Sim4 complex subunit Fta4 [Scheffersomyces xylosifermentans]|uniref:kinetochore Sim4 complex subunit Fta4 n=1 Tax=Scheffersomyces xylosifermentans TaxID=1304137 RepID=UPI00315D06BA
MDHSYVYTKRFIDQQVKTLNRPLAVTESLQQILANQSELDHLNQDASEPISEAKLRSILQKVNVRLKKHNLGLFPLQITNQIVQQILKVEQYKLSVVNERLAKIRYVLRPLLLPDFQQLTNQDPAAKLKEFGVLVNELPEGKYLIVGEDSDDIDAEDSESSDSQDYQEGIDNILVQDDSDKVEKPVSSRRVRRHFKRQISSQLSEELGNSHTTDQLLDNYESLRLQLKQAHHELHYKFHKLNYLKTLKSDLVNSLGLQVASSQDTVAAVNSNADIYDSDEEIEQEIVNREQPSIQLNLMTNDRSSDANTLKNEINRFRVLVEKISYKLSNSEAGPHELRDEIVKLSKSK